MSPGGFPLRTKMAVLLHTPIVSFYSTTFITSTKLKIPNIPFSGCFFRPTKTPCLFLVRARATPFQKFVYPDPIPEFALHETKKFREELKKKLYKEKETFGSDFDAVLDTCTHLFGEFLAKEYGGPGTLTVEPFTDMLIELKQRKLPGANLAARASLLWAQNYLDHDWEIWNSKSP